MIDNPIARLECDTANCQDEAEIHLFKDDDTHAAHRIKKNAAYPCFFQQGLIEKNAHDYKYCSLCFVNFMLVNNLCIKILEISRF